MYVCACVNALWCSGGGQGTICRGQFSPLIMCILGIKLRLGGPAESTVTGWDILPAEHYSFSEALLYYFTGSIGYALDLRIYVLLNDLARGFRFQSFTFSFTFVDIAELLRWHAGSYS